MHHRPCRVDCRPSHPWQHLTQLARKHIAAQIHHEKKKTLEELINGTVDVSLSAESVYPASIPSGNIGIGNAPVIISELDAGAMSWGNINTQSIATGVEKYTAIQLQIAAAIDQDNEDAIMEIILAELL